MKFRTNGRSGFSWAAPSQRLSLLPLRKGQTWRFGGSGCFSTGTTVRSACRQVAGCREADIRLSRERPEARIGRLHRRRHGGPVSRGVVDHDSLEGAHRLATQRIEAAHQVRAGTWLTPPLPTTGGTGRSGTGGDHSGPG